ncbi:uncharacterized protein L203_106004 [Cryptococcus depauperatus CBS 7841]|uniref:Uncharacterized protein n=1 Tax=Cryptococcus depauperatus CBS 7841 TaxID=1295531 RepID=A0A1E3IUY7_9TREE|nr:hypothetical protein L203_00711 [Cryptococcus depauperatus CBS 7841]
MRTRIPVSVVRLIESFQKPDFKPIQSLRYVDSSSTPEPSFAGSAIAKKLQTDKDIKESRTWMHASAPYVVRKNANSRAATFHEHLSSNPLPSSPTTMDMLNRQVFYSKAISLLIGTWGDLEAIVPLLERSLEEGVPISTPTFTQILQSTLHHPSPEQRRVIIQSAIPLFPDKLDIPLLDLVLRHLIRDSSIGPDAVESTINQCLALEGKNGKENWPWEVWELMLYAYTPNGDFASASKLLREFKSVVCSYLAGPSTSANPKRLETEEKEAIIRFYTGIMNVWCLFASAKQRNRIKIGSHIPRQLTKDMIQVMGEEQMNVRFITAWLKAEIVAENWDSLNEIIEKFFEVEMGEEISDSVASEAWATLFSAYDTQAPSLLPLRTCIAYYIARGVFEQFGSIDDFSFPNPSRPLNPKSMSKSVINSILRAVFHPLQNRGLKNETAKVDLPLLLCVLRLLKSYLPVQKEGPHQTTIDILSAGLYHTAQSLPSSTLHSLALSSSNVLSLPTSKSYRSMLKKKKWAQHGLGKEEWEILTRAIHYHRLSLASENGLSDSETDLVHLPLSIPVARLATTTPTVEHDDDKWTSTITARYPLNNKQTSSSTQVLFPAVMILLERLVIAFAMIEIDENNPLDVKTREGMDDTELLKTIMKSVYEDLNYLSRRERRVAKRDKKTAGGYQV